MRRMRAHLTELLGNIAYLAGLALLGLVGFIAFAWLLLQLPVWD
jgi:hypothetical protein